MTTLWEDIRFTGRSLLKNPAFTLADILKLLRAEPELAAINRHIAQRVA